MSLPFSMADFVPCDRLLQKAYFVRLARERLLIRLASEKQVKLYIYIIERWVKCTNAGMTAIKPCSKHENIDLLAWLVMTERA